MKATARLYQCGQCYCQVIICRRCDRGNLYCDGKCADIARSQSQSRAQKKYQSSRKGRCNNARRQNRFRERRREKVTQQGSTLSPSNDLLPKAKNASLNVENPVPPNEAQHNYCHFCGCECSPFLRRGFIRHRIDDLSLNT